MPEPQATASMGLVGVWLCPIWNLGSVVPGVSAKEQCVLQMAVI